MNRFNVIRRMILRKLTFPLYAIITTICLISVAILNTRPAAASSVASFAAATSFGVGSTPLSVAVADLNNDGKPDMVTANNGSNNVSVRLGNGLGGFAAAQSFNAGTGPSSVAVGDFNKDG